MTVLVNPYRFGVAPSASGRYFRIRAPNTNNASGFMGLKEVIIIDDAGTDIAKASAGATYSGTSSNGGAYANATDGNPESFWSTGGAIKPTGGHFIRFTWASAQTFRAISILPRGEFNEYPVDFVFEVSNDDITYTPIFTSTAAMNPAAYNNYNLNPSNPFYSTSATPETGRYRVRALDTDGVNEAFGVRTFELYAAIGGPDQVDLAGVTKAFIGSHSGSGFEPAKAFDGDNATFWSSLGVAAPAGGHWVGVSYYGGSEAIGFKLRTRGDFGEDPNSWVVERSTNGGSSWTVMFTGGKIAGNVDHVEYWDPAYPYTVTLTNPGFELNAATGWTTRNGGGPTAAASANGGAITPRTGSYLGLVSANQQLPWWDQTITLPVGTHAEVDAGTLKATLSVYLQGFASDSDSAAPVIQFFDGSSTLLAEKTGEFSDPSSWTQASAEFWVPPNTRSIRFGLKGYRVTGTDCSVAADDFSLVIDTTAKPHQVLDTFAGTSTSGWTATAGALGTFAAAYGITGLYGAGGDVTAYRDVALPGGLNASVDAGTAAIRAAFLMGDVVNAAGDKARVWIECRSSTGGTVLGTMQTGGATETPTVPYKGFDLSMAVPAGTRSFRINFQTEKVTGTDSDGYLARGALMIEA